MIFFHTGDLQDTKYIIDSFIRSERIFFYANVNYDRPTIHPWQRCLYKKGRLLSNEYSDNDGETIVISDSDDDDDANDLPRCKLNSIYFFNLESLPTGKCRNFIGVRECI